MKSASFLSKMPRRLRQGLTISLMLLLLYTIIGFLVVPVVLKGQILKRLPALTHRSVTVQVIHFNPYTLVLTVRGFNLTEPDGSDYAGFEEFSANLELRSVFKRGFVFREIRLVSPAMHIILDKNGVPNFANLLNPNPPPPQTGPATPLPLVIVESFSISNGLVSFTDQSIAHPARIKLDQLGVALRNITTLTNAPVTLADLTARCNEAGMIGANGTIVLQPFSAEIQINISDLDLRPIQPYVQEQANLAITAGTLTTTGRVVLAAPDTTGPRLRFLGDVTIAKFASIDSLQSRDFVKWDRLHLAGITAAVAPISLHLDAVTLTGLDATLIIGTNKQVNLTDILQKKPASPTVMTAAPTNTAAEIAITINTVTLEQANLKIRDQSVEPNTSAGITELSGTIRGLSSAHKDRADVDLHGKVDALSSFTITGQVNPLSGDLYSDVALLFNNIDLTPISPYMGRYAGFPVQKGKLNLDLHWRLSSKELKAENKVVVDRLTLGQHTASPDATKLPVKLALALLTDRHGKIDLDVPLTGRLDDPAFRVWPLVGQVVMNLLAKAATSPFTLLGKLVGGGAEDLGFIDFAAGATDLDPAGLDKIQKLAKVLYERPALAVEIVPSLDPLADRDALAKAKLLETLKVRRLHELTATSQTPIALSAITLTDADRQRLIPALYTETFGAVTNGAGTNPAGASGAKPANVILNFTWGAQTNAGAATNQGLAPAQSLAEMEAALLPKMNVTDDDLHQLLKDRAVTVQTALLQQKEPPEAERLFITNPEIPKPDPANPSKPRVNFVLQ